MIFFQSTDHHASPSGLTIYHLIFPLSKIYGEFWSNLYITPYFGKVFKFMVLRLLEMNFWFKILNLLIFTHAPKQHSSRVLIITPHAEQNYPFPPGSIFWKFIFHQQNGERGRKLWGWKMTKIKLVKILLSFGNSLFDFCFVAP